MASPDDEEVKDQPTLLSTKKSDLDVKIADYHSDEEDGEILDNNQVESEEVEVVSQPKTEVKLNISQLKKNIREQSNNFIGMWSMNDTVFTYYSQCYWLILTLI